LSPAARWEASRLVAAGVHFLNLQRGFFVVEERRLSDNWGSNSERGSADNTAAPLTTSAIQEQDMADPKSSTGKSPAFQFYPDSFLADANVIVMTMAERGVYITLICICWQQGYIAADTAVLSKLCAMPLAAFNKLWPAVEKCFRPKGDRMVHPRLDRERQKQAEFKRERSDAGKAGASKRWQKDGSAMAQPSTENGTAIVLPMAKDSSLSLSSSLSSDFSQERAEHARAPRIEIKPTNGTNGHASKPSEPNEIGLRAGRFLERYGELHAQHRNGAKLVKAPAFRSALGGGHMEFQEAVTLCQTWDDARLELLAKAFLTVDDDDWINSGPRTIARFRSRASWVDDKLKAAGL
jgi:uncharacterized protein YdaU (DUF1376 family)